MNSRIICLVVLATLVGCSPSATIDALPDAKKVASTFFKHFKNQEFDELDVLYEQRFWQAMPQETWHKVLPNVYEELGNIEKCELQNWQQTTQATTSGSGNIVSLNYACKHRKYESVISFTIYKPLSGGESKILGQNFSSLGLLLE